MKWQPGDTTHPVGRLQSSILEIANDFHLEQKVGFTTRKDPSSGAENILDLLFTSRPALIHNVRPNSGISDHETVLADICRPISSNPTVKPQRNIFMWKNVDENKFRAAATELQDSFMKSNPKSNSVETNWCFFRDGLIKIVNDLVPKKLSREKPDLHGLQPTCCD